MIFKPLFAVLIAAFSLSAITIFAQVFPHTISKDSFNQLLETDKTQLIQLGLQQRLDTQQLAILIPSVCQNPDMPTYCAALSDAYWRQLSPKDKLSYANVAFMDKFNYSKAADYTQCVYETHIEYIIANPNEYKNAWGDSLFTDYIRDKIYLSIILLDVEWDKWRVPPPVSMCMDTANAYLARLETRLPEFVPYTKALLMISFVYNDRTNPKEYYFHFNNYVLEYINDPEKLYRMSKRITDYETEPEYLQTALNIINKAIKINPTNQYIVHRQVIAMKILNKKD